MLGVSPGFNAAAPLVSNAGAKAFVAPGNGDIRGPCPGLNAWLITTTFSQAIAGTTQGNQLFTFICTSFGLDADLNVR